MNKIDLEQRQLITQKKLDNMKHADLLPKYPADNTPIQVRQKKKPVVRKVVFDTK
jgi:hypothetical protein